MPKRKRKRGALSPAQKLLHTATTELAQNRAGHLSAAQRRTFSEAGGCVGALHSGLVWLSLLPLIYALAAVLTALVGGLLFRPAVAGLGQIVIASIALGLAGVAIAQGGAWSARWLDGRLLQRVASVTGTVRYSAARPGWVDVIDSDGTAQRLRIPDEVGDWLDDGLRHTLYYERRRRRVVAFEPGDPLLPSTERLRDAATDDAQQLDEAIAWIERSDSR